MVTYICDTCHEKKFKQKRQVFNHLHGEHRIHIDAEANYRDKRLLCWDDEQGCLSTTFPKKEFTSKYYCHNCKKTLKNIVSVLKHVSEVHNVIVWYEKRSFVYLDGLIR